MKLWQKVYLFTILLFVILLNAGMYVVFEMTYQKDIVTEQKQAEAEYHMLTMGMVRSFESMEQQDVLTDSRIRALLELYENYYDDVELTLTLWREDDVVYPEGTAPKGAWNCSANENELILDGAKTKHVIIRGMLYQGEDTYYLQYEKELAELDAVWATLEKQYMLISFGFSLVLAILLFVILKNTMKPMAKLSAVVDDMAEGNLQSRAKIKGVDEVASLGRHFNRMADKIEDNIKLIQQESDAKQEFVDNFAHELKSPLTSIYGFAEYVQKANVSEDEKIQCMGYIMEETNRLLQLSYTLLNMARIRNDEIEMAEVSFSKLEEAVTNRMMHLCKEREVKLACKERVEKLYVNEALVSVLLCNLIQNAIYACESGGNIVWGAEEKEGKLRLYVEDDGCGMTPEQIERVREPFYRVDKARSRGGGRTGLGLALCSQIVEYHTGEMVIFSEINQGTKINVYLPK